MTCDDAFCAENDGIMENDREGRSMSDRKIDPVKAKVDMLIKQRLDTKRRDDYGREKRNTLNMIAYYDYDGDEEQEMPEAPVNEQKVGSLRDDKLSIEDKTKIKRGKRT